MLHFAVMTAWRRAVRLASAAVLTAGAVLFAAGVTNIRHEAGGPNEALVLGVHSLPMIPALALLAGFASTAASPLGRRRLALLGVALAGLIFEPWQWPAFALLGAGAIWRRLDPNGRPLLAFALVTCLPVGYAYGGGGGISVHFRIFEAMAQAGFAAYLLWVSRSSVSVAAAPEPTFELQPHAGV